MRPYVHNKLASVVKCCWAEAHIKIARMTLTIKLDGNWSSFQLANSAPPLSGTDSAIAPSARWCNIRSAGSSFQYLATPAGGGTENTKKQRGRSLGGRQGAGLFYSFAFPDAKE